MPNTDRKKRVLFICPQPFFEWRGSPIRVKFNMIALSELGYEVDLLTLPIGADQEIDNVNVIRAWNLFGSKKISIGPSLLKLWFDLILLIQGIGLVLRNRYDVLHGNEEAGFICYLLTFICRARCVFEKHSDSKSYHPSAILRPFLAAYNYLEKLTARKADAVISTGPGLTEQALSWVNPDACQKRFTTIPDVPSSIVESSEEETATARTAMIDDPKQVIITYAGSFASYQGIEIIFEAIPTIVANNELARFVIIGGTGDEISYYKKQLSEQGIVKQIHFLGKINPDLLPQYLAGSDILLAPRKSGVNSPLKILDYFKAGGAIVATNTVANRRLLNEDNAVMCEATVDAFSKTINDLVDSPEKRKRLGENAHKLYKSTYNFSVFKSQIKDVYDTVLSK